MQDCVYLALNHPGSSAGISSSDANAVDELCPEPPPAPHKLLKGCKMLEGLWLPFQAEEIKPP